MGFEIVQGFAYRRNLVEVVDSSFWNKYSETMGRPREFDEKTVLDGAIRLFGARGFDSVPVDTALKEIGLNRASFYKIFGSKHGLCRSALETVVEETTQAVSDEEMRDFLLVVLVELAPTDQRLYDLSLRAAGRLFGDDSESLGDHVLSRARRLLDTH